MTKSFSKSTAYDYISYKMYFPLSFPFPCCPCVHIYYIIKIHVVPSPIIPPASTTQGARRSPPRWHAGRGLSRKIISNNWRMENCSNDEYIFNILKIQPEITVSASFLLFFGCVFSKLGSQSHQQGGSPKVASAGSRTQSCRVSQKPGTPFFDALRQQKH